ncbi:MAG TPA: GNAT family N-acetyltransferase [Candidatus Eremiobacteraeota bacterium]|nr:MAG: hypothetical protein BWY64_01646 [bacterium ADurb.Bin363]HPZ08482.1 GNAT family N-acetyltransferase [Candidatus Eremiobacteraeota bacterium]
MDIIVRKIKDEDFPSVFQLASECFKYHLSPLRENINLEKARKNYLRDLELVKQNLPVRNNSYFLIAESSDGKLLGFLLMATDVTESTTGIEQAWIFDFAIGESYWDSEVPHKLLARAESIAMRKGLRHIAIQITCFHEKALNFLKSRNYEEERKRMYKKFPFESNKEKERKEIIKALEGIKFKIKFPLK